jgi:ketosteroid isomerase-like protein
MTRDDVQRWLDRYVEAWFAYDADLIGDLFTEDAEYRHSPSEDPLKGRAAIVHDWLNPRGSADKRDRPGTVDFGYAPHAVDGDRAVIVGWTVYRKAPGGAVERTYDNAWLVDFVADGRCRSFTEFYMKRR